MIVDRLDHLTLIVADVDATLAFYERVLGMAPVTLEDGTRRLAFGTQCLVVRAATDDETARVGAAELCLITRTPMDDILAQLAACDIAVDRPTRREGAVGPIESVTLRDPDGNRIEVANQIEAVA